MMRRIELEGGRWLAATAAKKFLSAKQYLKPEKWNKKHKKKSSYNCQILKTFPCSGCKDSFRFWTYTTSLSYEDWKIKKSHVMLFYLKMHIEFMVKNMMWHGCNFVEALWRCIQLRLKFLIHWEWKHKTSFTKTSFNSFTYVIAAATDVQQCKNKVISR